MILSLVLFFVLSLGVSAAPARAGGDPVETIRQSEQVLSDLVAIPGRQIPLHLLADAQGVAIIPDVTKIGFIAGVRHGHGVVMVRDAEGEWSLPQFITLTGGSVGWQAGIQGTDVVLVFRTRKGVEGLMRGKFTIGADASVSAGPVGRNAAAATDATLKSEILSYSRSRGLFLGVALDGSALEIDRRAHFAYYDAPVGAVPQRVPDSAPQLRQYLVELTQSNPGASAPQEAPPATATSPAKLEAVRRSLVHHAGQLHAVLSPDWRQYLALPREILDPATPPNMETLVALRQRFEKTNATPAYKNLAERPEFQTTFELLRQYIDSLSTTGPSLQLPPPPSK
jgi:lipid-binding SYLF domain-containing protein